MTNRIDYKNMSLLPANLSANQTNKSLQIPKLQLLTINSSNFVLKKNQKNPF